MSLIRNTLTLMLLFALSVNGQGVSKRPGGSPGGARDRVQRARVAYLELSKQDVPRSNYVQRVLEILRDSSPAEGQLPPKEDAEFRAALVAKYQLLRRTSDPELPEGSPTAFNIPVVAADKTDVPTTRTGQLAVTTLRPLLYLLSPIESVRSAYIPDYVNVDSASHLSYRANRLPGGARSWTGADYRMGMGRVVIPDRHVPDVIDLDKVVVGDSIQYGAIYYATYQLMAPYDWSVPVVNKWGPLGARFTRLEYRMREKGSDWKDDADLLDDWFDYWIDVKAVLEKRRVAQENVRKRKSER